MSSESLDKAYATQIANIEKATGKKLAEWITIINKSDWIAEQYKGKENLKPWYDKIMAEINKFGKDIEIAPKKAYVSLRRKKQFAILQPSTKDRLDVGLNIKGVAASGNVEEGAKWNAMCTHRIRVEDEKTIKPDKKNRPIDKRTVLKILFI